MSFFFPSFSTERFHSHATRRFRGTSTTWSSETGEEQHPGPCYAQEVFIGYAFAVSCRGHWKREKIRQLVWSGRYKKELNLNPCYIWINFVHLSLVITIWLWPFSLPWRNNKSEETIRYSNKPQQKQDIDFSIFDRKGNPHAPLPQHLQ